MTYFKFSIILIVTEEIINPKRNLTLSLLISIPLITVIYVFVNISYFTVMTKADMLASPAVAIVISIVTIIIATKAIVTASRTIIIAIIASWSLREEACDRS